MGQRFHEVSLQTPWTVNYAQLISEMKWTLKGERI
jgi:hypothetical protein